MNISFFGLSHLGLNYLSASAAKGFKVIGYDKNKNFIENQIQIQRFLKSYIYLKIKKYKNNILFTSNLKDLKKVKLFLYPLMLIQINMGKVTLK